MKRWTTWAALLFLGCVAMPIVAYIVGGRVAGPYAGPRGLASYLGALYQDALRGRLLALALLSAPILFAAIWLLRSLLLRRYATGRAVRPIK